MIPGCAGWTPEAGGAAHRYLGEDGEHQGQDRQVHANPLASVALLNVFRHGDNLAETRGQGLGTPLRSHPELLKDKARPTHYRPSTWDWTRDRETSLEGLWRCI